MAQISLREVIACLGVAVQLFLILKQMPMHAKSTPVPPLSSLMVWAGN